MEVKIQDPLDPKTMVWKVIKSSQGKIYLYDSKEEAERVLNLCYGDAVPKDRLRVVEAL